MPLGTLASDSSLKLANRELISDQLWSQLVDRIVKNEDMSSDLAERVLDQALGFLYLCGTDPAGHYSPSTLVDIGWHTFILYTREYAEFCQRICGFFIHHEPTDDMSGTIEPSLVSKTIAAMHEYGISIDLDVWKNHAVRCSSHCRNTCSHSHK